MKQPNILVIMSDEHNANVIGCYGNSTVKTPNLDTLAQSGTIFENCYTPSPLCVPARLSFTAGKYVSKCGAWNNNCRLPSEDYPSIARLLNVQGYESYIAGKMHYAADERYGFKMVIPKTNHAKKNGKIRRVDLPKSDDPNVDTDNYDTDRSPRFDEFRIADSESIRDNDTNVTKYTTEFLKSRRPEDKPFLYIAGYTAPHFPLVVPEKYFNLYKGKVPMPEIPEGHIETLPFQYKMLRKSFKMENVDPETVQKGRELYYGLVTWLDDQIGEVLKTLGNSEIADNTVVIYTADHGENMGDHGLWWKNVMYDSASKIPLIVSWPSCFGQGQRRTQVCSLLDVVQTIAELGGAKTPDDWDGNSMINLLNDNNANWPNLAVIEYYAHNITAGYCAIRKDNYKYVYFNKADCTHSSEIQLFDLEKDQAELNDLSSDPQYKDLMKEMHLLLIKQIGRDPEEVEKSIKAGSNA